MGQEGCEAVDMLSGGRWGPGKNSPETMGPPRKEGLRMGGGWRGKRVPQARQRTTAGPARD